MLRFGWGWVEVWLGVVESFVQGIGSKKHRKHNFL